LGGVCVKPEKSEISDPDFPDLVGAAKFFEEVGWNNLHCFDRLKYLHYLCAFVAPELFEELEDLRSSGLGFVQDYFADFAHGSTFSQAGLARGGRNATQDCGSRVAVAAATSICWT
jgi:hypothetical protein